MKDGFIKAAAITPAVQPADPAANAESILEEMRAAHREGARITVFPELALTGATCGDLFLQAKLLTAAEDALKDLVKASRRLKGLFIVGLPARIDGRVYNAAAAFAAGHLLAIVPKEALCDAGSHGESRYFVSGEYTPDIVRFAGEDSVLFGTGILLEIQGLPQAVVGIQIGEDIEVPEPGYGALIADGATLIAHLTANEHVVGGPDFRRQVLLSASGVCGAGFISANAGAMESTTDLVYAAGNLIAENGVLLAQGPLFEEQRIYADIDAGRLDHERRRRGQQSPAAFEGAMRVEVPVALEETKLSRVFPRSPFIPEDTAELAHRCEEILQVQSRGLAGRMRQIRAQRAVLGISGGLDSTLALLVMARAFDHLGLPRKNILAVTMPCFGTTDRTYNNACAMVKALGAELREIDIKASVRQHFADIGQSEDNHDVTYENAQARERTQILMDIANQIGGLVVGTGDLSELALGWATYNGDHMSMYGVNASVPKTLVRHLTAYCADTCGDKKLTKVLRSVLDTPVSPELLPPEKDGTIAQRTEDLVGPYELHDYFLYYFLRWGYTPSKLFRVAKLTFAGSYTEAEIYKWLRTFHWRFFSQQFKRSCMPDGPKVGSVGLSPRGDLKMPSDVTSALWIRELEEIRPE